MFCSKCGSVMGAQDRFCPVCGEAAENCERPAAIIPAADTRTASRRIHPAVVAVSATAIALLLVAGGAFFFGLVELSGLSGAKWDGSLSSNALWGLLNDDVADSLSSSADSVAALVGAASADEGDGAGGQAGGIDLSDDDDRRKVNLFLSNFTEIGFYASSSTEPEEPYVYGLLDSFRAAQFGVYHAAYNSPDSWEYCSGTESPWFPVTDSSGYDGVDNGYNVRIPADTVERAVSSFLKIDFDASQLTGDFHYEGGYVYFRVTNGMGIPQGVAYATAVEDTGDGHYRITFDVYGGSESFYDVQDGALYSMSAEELKARFGTNGPTSVGEAVVEMGSEDDLAPYRLISYYTARAI